MREAFLMVSACLSWLVSFQLEIRVFGEEPETLDAVISAWEQREAAVRTFQLRWTTHHTDMAGSLTARRGGSEPNGADFPPEDFTHTSTESLRFDGHRLRHEFEGGRWNFMAGGVLTAMKEVTLFDGKQVQQFQLPTNSDAPDAQGLIKQGYILDRQELPVQDSLHAQPIFLFLRPFDPIMNQVVREKLSVVSVEQQGSKGRLIVEQKRPGGMKTYWVAPALDFSVVRIEYKRMSGELMYQIDVEYSKDSDEIWVPRRWNIVTFGRAGAIAATDTCEVVACEVNRSLTDADFRLDFPEDTIVVAEGFQYYKSHNGELRPMAGDAQDGVGTSTRWWILVLNVAVIFALIAILILRRARSRRTTARA